MRVGLQNGDPHVVRIMSALDADKLRVIGALHAVWCVFDQYSDDGRISYTPAEMDSCIGLKGFSQSMIDVGWLIFDGANTLTMHNFDVHNGRSAKRRSSESIRKQNGRKMSACDADILRTREEKRREENKIKSLYGQSSKGGGFMPSEKQPVMKLEKVSTLNEANNNNGNSTPSGLNQLQYAARLIEEIKMPDTPQNLRHVAAAIKSEEKSQHGLDHAYDFLLVQARAEIERKGTVTGFWFQDAKWRENKKAKPGDYAFQSIAAVDEKRRKAIARISQ